MSLRDRAMLVSLNVSVWGASKQDKHAGAETARNNNADEDQVVVVKKLVPKEKLEKIRSIASSARQTYYKYSSPWGDDGSRIMASTAYMEAMSELQKHTQDMIQAVKEFKPEYAQCLRQAPVLLGKMFDPADYPTEDEIEDKFGIKVNVFPLPDAEDWRITEGLSDVEIDNIKQSITDRVNASHKIVMKDLWTRVHKVVQAMAERLPQYTGGREGRFNDSLVENVREVAMLLPKLNVSGDSKLDELAQDVLKRLCAFDADALRSSQTVREMVTQQAEDILSNMAGYVGS